jgi:cytoskeletal protein RodZ
MRTKTQDKKEKEKKQSIIKKTAEFNFSKKRKKHREKIMDILGFFAYVLLLFVSILLFKGVVEASIEIITEISFNKELFEKFKCLMFASISLSLFVIIFIVINFVLFLVDVYEKYNKGRKN